MIDRFLIAPLELLRLAFAIRGRFSGRYWRWRTQTAMGGPGPRPTPREVRRAALDFALWRRRMRTMR